MAPGAMNVGHSAHSDELHRLLQGRDTRWYVGRLAQLNLILLLLLITSSTNGYDGSMMNGLQTLGTWKNYFGDPQGGLLGLFNAIQNIGGLAGLPFAPYISDRWGRRMAIFLGCIIMILATILQSAAQNIGMFIGARFLIGFGLSFACIAAPVLITELAFPTHRAPATSLYNSTWYLGSIIAAWTTYGTFRLDTTWGWRIPSIVQGAPSVLQVLLIWFCIPESPRWLIDHGKDAQAMKTLSYYHCKGDDNDPLLAFEYNEIKEALRLEKLANKSSTYKSLFTSPGNRRRMAIIIPLAFFSQWSGNGIVSYYLGKTLDGVGIRSEGQKNLINGILQVYNLVTAYIGALVVDKAGRRVLFLTSTAGMCVSYAVWTACAATYAKSYSQVDADGYPIGANTGAGNGVLAAIFFYYGFYNIALSPLLVSYTVEILPFRIRSKGLMIMQFSVSCSLVFNQYVNPIAMDALDWRYYIIYTCWIAFEFCYLYKFVVETKGRDGRPLPLEEIAVLFDGHQAQEDLTFYATAAEGRPGEDAAGVVEKGDFGDEKPLSTGEHIESAHHTTR